MDVKLRRADIVIMASAHNPSIVDPRWLKDNGLVAEDPKHFVHTPDFSMFDSELISLIVDRERLQITAKKTNRDQLKSLADMGIGYLDLLPHTPYQALGLNFVWHTEADAGESIPKIDIKIGSVGDLSNILTDHKLNYGSIIYARRDPYLLRLRIEPQGESMLIYNFNYHHEIKGIDIEKVKNFLGNFTNLYEHSKTVVENTYLVRGEEG